MALIELAQWGVEYAVICAATDIDTQVPADTSAWNDPTVATTFVVNSIGVASNIYGIPLLNRPDFSPGQEIIDQRKAIGVPFRNTAAGYEFQQGNRLPSVVYEFDVTKRNIVPFLWTLFQKGTSEGEATVYLKTFSSYSEGNEDCEAYLCLLKKMTSEDTNSHIIGGAIAHTITLSAESGMPLKANCEMFGYNMADDFDFNAQASIIDYDSTAPLLWANATIKLAGTAINTQGFNMTIKNNAVPKFYNSKHPNKYVLGDITVEGTITLPWSSATVGGNAQIDNFVNGTDATLSIYWGNETPSADGDFKILTNIRYNNAAVVGEDELGIELPFIAAKDEDDNPSATSSIIIYSGESVNRSIS